MAIWAVNKKLDSGERVKILVQSWTGLFILGESSKSKK